jgi:pyridoxamine 5'-phosphate oxidase
MQGRFELEKAVARYAAKFAIGRIPRPPHWSGFRIAPMEIEFWRDRPFRLHDRQLYSRERGVEGGAWKAETLFP